MPSAKSPIDFRFARTLVGRSELHWPSLDLPNRVRALLAAVDMRRSIDQCLLAVRDARLSDATMLLSHGLIRNVPIGLANVGGRMERSPAHFPLQCLLSLPPDPLYALITQQAKRRLGLIHGFRVILTLERCSSVYEYHAVAIEFVAEIYRRGTDADIVRFSELVKGASRAHPPVVREGRCSVVALPVAERAHERGFSLLGPGDS